MKGLKIAGDGGGGLNRAWLGKMDMNPKCRGPGWSCWLIAARTLNRPDPCTFSKSVAA